MSTNLRPFSIDKVKALRAYFFRMRNSMRGKTEYTDLDTTVTLCDQLLSFMTEAEQHERGPAPEKPAANSRGAL
jgi:hypothetical protein